MSFLGPRSRVALAVTLSLAASILFYFWTVESTHTGLKLEGAKRDYYNLLVQGFRKGHLYMDVAPDPALLALPAKERPGYAPFLLDASLYQNRYYLYFGVVPALALYLPYALLTGQGLPEAGAALIFASAGLIFSALWWLEARKRFFPSSGPLWAAISLLALSVGTAIPSTLRRPLFYEVAIAAGYAFTMLSLWAFLRAHYAERRGRAWLVLGAAAAGLAMGCRANLAASCLLLVFCGALGSRVARERGRVWAVAASGAVFGVIALGLGAYNAARFGSPLEFGHTYQLGVEPHRLFRLGNFLHNAVLYYLRPPALNGYFPFVAPSAEGIKPEDYVGRETAHGEWIWLPLALAACSALVWRLSRQARGINRDWLWALGMPALVFGINFIVTASAGVRANRYMLDFHPMLVLAVVAALGCCTEGSGWPKREGKIAAGLGMLAAVVFNLCGSFQAQEFLRATDPTGYRRIAAIANRIVWPFLSRGPSVGDRGVNLRWPHTPKPGTAEPICAAGTPNYDDILWVEYRRENEARFIYQNSEFGRAYGRWFKYQPGGEADLRISGAFLLPGAGHPWFGARPVGQQEILKRSLVVSVDGSDRFDRDVPSHDSSPSLQSWGTWTNADGVPFSFSGAALRVREEPIHDARALPAVRAGESIRLRLELPADAVGRYEPLLQSGTLSKFDTLVLHYVRPGYVQLIHDQLGSGAQPSQEFWVDATRPQDVEIGLPFADSRLDWIDREPRFRGAMGDRMKVTWNGRSVFEPAVPPVPNVRPLVILGANILRSSISQAMFDGILEVAPPDKALGAIQTGDIHFRLIAAAALGAECGMLTRFERSDGVEAGLWWRRENPAGALALGWTEGTQTVRSSRLVPGDELQRLVESISRDGSAVGDAPHRLNSDPVGRFVVESGHAVILALRTGFFSQGTVQASGLGAAECSGTALRGGPPSIIGEEQKPSPPAFPGKIRIVFEAGAKGRITRSPLLEAGRVGAADSIYLRALPGGNYVIGLDHWSVGTIESAKFDLAPDGMHAVGIEMSSLENRPAMADGSIRVSVDGRVVLDQTTALYALRPAEVYYGANPLGMSTSVGEFEGDLIAVRSQQTEADLVFADR